MREYSGRAFIYLASLLAVVAFAFAPSFAEEGDDYPTCNSACDRKIKGLLAAIASKKKNLAARLVSDPVYQIKNEKVILRRSDSETTINSRFVPESDRVSFDIFFKEVTKCREEQSLYALRKDKEKDFALIILNCGDGKKAYFRVYNNFDRNLNISKFGQCAVVVMDNPTRGSCIPELDW